jgi:hypothetical protein
MLFVVIMYLLGVCNALGLEVYNLCSKPLTYKGGGASSLYLSRHHRYAFAYDALTHCIFLIEMAVVILTKRNILFEIFKNYYIKQVKVMTIATFHNRN